MRKAPGGTRVLAREPMAAMRFAVMITVRSRSTAAGSSRSGWITVAPMMAIDSSAARAATALRSATANRKVRISDLDVLLFEPGAQAFVDARPHRFRSEEH